LPGYVYAADNDAIYVNLFIQGRAEIDFNGQKIELKQKTNYPWDGKIAITVLPEKSAEFSLKIRIPGWAQNKPVPSDLYHYLTKDNEKPVLMLNGEKIDYQLQKGYATINRKWRSGDSLELILPMKTRKVFAHEKVEADRGKLSLERGPIVFCAEEIDNMGDVLNLVLPKNEVFNYEFNSELLHGIGMLKGKAIAVHKTNGAIEKKEQPFTAIPYYAWAHRGKGKMTVWFPYDERFVNLENCEQE
jgi:hypothetical protein